MGITLITPLAAAHRLGISTETLRRWTIEGRLSEVRTAGGHRRYHLSEITALAPAPSAIALAAPTILGYARVSSHDQKASGDLDRQIERLRQSGASEVISEVASGLSERRAGLARLLSRVEANSIETVMVVTRDRLARFGVGFIERQFSEHGVGLTVLEPEDHEGSPESELTADLLALVASFSGRLYGLRSARRRALTRCVEEAMSDGD
jgi:excisionase family DNA binding protein